MTTLVFILERIWPALAASAALGFGMGLATEASRPPASSGRLAYRLAGGAIVVAAGLALAGIVPGRAGLVLEIGILVVLAYFSACLLGCLARRAGPAPTPPDSGLSREGAAPDTAPSG